MIGTSANSLDMEQLRPAGEGGSIFPLTDTLSRLERRFVVIDEDQVQRRIISLFYVNSVRYIVHADEKGNCGIAERSGGT